MGGKKGRMEGGEGKWNNKNKCVEDERELCKIMYETEDSV